MIRSTIYWKYCAIDYGLTKTARRAAQIYSKRQIVLQYVGKGNQSQAFGSPPAFGLVKKISSILAVSSLLRTIPPPSPPERQALVCFENTKPCKFPHKTPLEFLFARLWQSSMHHAIKTQFFFSVICTLKGRVLYQKLIGLFVVQISHPTPCL